MIALIFFLSLQDEIVKDSDHELAAEAAVTVKTVVGRVRLTGTDAKSAHVKSVKRGRDRELVEIRVEADKSHLTVTAEFPRRRDIEIEIEIDVQVPRSAKSLKIDNVSGSIEVKEARGDASLANVSGSISVEGLTGNLTAVSISGDVRVAKLAADRASISLTSGSLEGAGEVGELELKNVSGGSSFDMTPRGKTWTVKSSNISGNTALRFPATAGGKADLKSLSGGLECDFELRDIGGIERGRIDRSLRGTFGDGAGAVRASSISGDVSLRRMK